MQFGWSFWHAGGRLAQIDSHSLGRFLLHCNDCNHHFGVCFVPLSVHHDSRIHVLAALPIDLHYIVHRFVVTCVSIAVYRLSQYIVMYRINHCNLLCVIAVNTAGALLEKQQWCYFAQMSISGMLCGPTYHIDAFHISVASIKIYTLDGNKSPVAVNTQTI